MEGFERFVLAVTTKSLSLSVMDLRSKDLDSMILIPIWRLLAFDRF